MLSTVAMCRCFALILAATALAAPVAAAAGEALPPPISAATSASVTPPAAPATNLPDGGLDYHTAMLSWSHPGQRPGRRATTTGVAQVLAAPVPITRISSPFGMRVNPVLGVWRHHAGVDLPRPYGSAVAAAADGVVAFAGWAGGYGLLVQIDHGNGLQTRYGHLSSLDVRSGDRVIQGNVLGGVGSTGRSTGPHLHFEVREDGTARDPLAMLGMAVALEDLAPLPRDEAAPLVLHAAPFGEKSGTVLPAPRLR